MNESIGYTSVKKLSEKYNVDVYQFISNLQYLSIPIIMENNIKIVSSEYFEKIDRFFTTYNSNQISYMKSHNIKPFFEGVLLLDLRKKYNLNESQFKVKCLNLGLEFKYVYCEEECRLFDNFIKNNSSLNRAELRELKYTKQGWIPLRKVLDEIDISSGTLNSYLKILNIKVYKPLHQLSFVSKEDKDKIIMFINEHNNTKERKLYLSKQSCINKYGVENGAKCDEIKKIISENVKKSCTKERTEKIINTKLKKYGKKSTTDSEKSMETRLKNHGSLVVNHTYKYDNILFDSSWELYFYIYNKEILQDDVQKGKIFEYICENKIHHYQCDFLVNDKNVEIKGNQYLDENGNLYFPYVKQTKTDSIAKQKLWDYKSQCMKENNVEIVSNDKMKDIIKIVDAKYTHDYVSLFRLDLKFPYLNQDLKDKSDMGLIHCFHKSIYCANRENNIPPVKAWEDKDLIKKSALNRLKYVKSCTCSDVLQGFNVAKIAPKVSVFRPKLGEYLLKKYCTQQNVFDPFSGFSGRMLASCNLGKSYYGQDINEEHVKESNEIIKYKNLSNAVVKVQDILTDDNKELISTTLFTCSPYGGKEHWNENEVEKSCDEWIGICLQKYKCSEYIFVVDDTKRYKDKIVEAIENKSHFGKNNEYVLYIK